MFEQKSEEVMKITEELAAWCRKVDKTMTAMDNTYMSVDNVEVDKMKADICAILDKAFGKEKQS